MSDILDFLSPPSKPVVRTVLETECFGSFAQVHIANYGDGVLIVEISLPKWSGHRVKSEALEGIAALLVLLAATEAALRANDTEDAAEMEDLS